MLIDRVMIFQTAVTARLTKGCRTCRFQVINLFTMYIEKVRVVRPAVRIVHIMGESRSAITVTCKNSTWSNSHKCSHRRESNDISTIYAETQAAFPCSQ